MWPARVVEGPLALRPLRLRDRAEWNHLRASNAAWLQRWEATIPRDGGPATPPITFGQYVRSQNRQARAGQARPWVITLHGRLIGQVTVSQIAYGSLSSAVIGYWISREVAGRGLMPLAVAMAADDCFHTLGLHRIEINIRPENAASLRVVTKLGLRDEGLRRAYLHIQGSWADHRTFALTREEVPGGLRPRALALEPDLSSPIAAHDRRMAPGGGS